MNIKIIPLNASNTLFRAALIVEGGKGFETRKNRDTPQAAIGDLVLSHPTLFNIANIDGIHHTMRF